MGNKSNINDRIDIFECINKDIYNQIKLIRNKAKKETNLRGEKFKYSSIETYNETQYHNNISILGERGSGKTSLLIDLRNRLARESDQNSDIIFEIITPDIKDKEDILGWIISLLIKAAKAIKLKKYPDNKLNCDTCKVQTKLDKCMQELKQSYFFRKTIHETIIANDYSSKIDYLNDNEEKLNADVDIKHRVKDLIAEIIDNLSEESEDAPLLIFVFDDVDIHSNKINEVLSVIMNYLAHPNIVNLIAGDYKSALENITLKMLEEDHVLETGLINVEINKDDMLKVRKNRAHEFLKKILPPIYRHYIPNLDNETKHDVIRRYLIDEISEDEFCKKTINKIKEYIYFNRDEIHKDYNKPIILYDYMSFLDTSIRGALNVINFIKARVLDDSFKNSPKKEKFEFLKDLLNVIIVSNRSFTIREKLIRDTINLSQYNYELPKNNNDALNFNGYINYYAIVNHMNKYVQENYGKSINENKFDTYYNIFMLANMFEIFIISLGLREDDTENTSINLDRLHGLNEYRSIVNMIRCEDNLNILPDIEEDLDSNKYMKEYICIKQNIFKSLRYNEVQQLFKKENGGYLESIYIDSFKHKGEVARYIVEMYDKDQNWSKSIIDWIIDNAPSEKIMKRNTIKKLEEKYEYNIGEVKYDYREIKKEDYKPNLVNLITYHNVGKSIDEYINWIKKLNKAEIINSKISNEINEKNILLEKINQELDEVFKNLDKDGFLVNINSESRKIKKILEINDRFLNSDINKEAWRTIKNNLIIEDENEVNIRNLSFIKNAIKINTKNELKNLDIDSSLIKAKSKYIVIQGEKCDLDMMNFVKSYYTKSLIKDVLKNQHPIIRFESIENQKESIEGELYRLKKEIELANSEMKDIESSISKNSIYNYINSKSRRKQGQFKMTNTSIEKYIKEYIDIVVLKYEDGYHKKNKFESLLDDFYEYIYDIKSLDKEIIELLTPATVNLSEEKLETYKSDLRNINDEIGIIDVNHMIYNVKGETKTSFIIKPKNALREDSKKQIQQLKSKLEMKKNYFNDDLYLLRKNVFKYAFNKTLYKHLEYTIYYEKEQMSKKVRTEYLIKKRDKLETISNDMGSSSLKKYLKSKSN